MADNKSKNKILIISIASMAVIAIALVVIIFIVNSSEDSDKSGSENEIIADNSSVEGMDDLKSAGMNQGDFSGTDGEKIDSSEKTTDPDTGTSSSNSTERSDKEESDSLTSDKNVESEKVTVILGQYKGLEAGYSPKTITDDDIEAELEAMKQQNSELVYLPNRGFEIGDMAIISFEGSVDGEIVDELTGVCLQVIIGNGIMPEKIEDSIVGKRVGDEFKIEVEYSIDYSYIPAVAGKTVSFDIKIEDGFAIKIPDVDDELIKSNTDYDSLAMFMDSEKDRLQKEADEKANEQMLNELKRKVIDGCQYSGSVDNEITTKYVIKIQDNDEYFYDNYMVDAVTYYQLVYGMTLEEYQKMVMEESEIEVKYAYALDEIAKQENLEVTEEEFDQEFTKQYIEEKGYASKEAVYAALSKSKVDNNVNTSVLRKKAEQLVVDSASIT